MKIFCYSWSRFLVCLFFLLNINFLHGQEIPRFILVDQFGYRPQAQKTAVIKNPRIGFDSDESFTPGAIYKVIDAVSGAVVYQGALQMFNNGAVDEASGDQIWWFDFSPVIEPGEYYIWDESNNAKSYTFRIDEEIYNEVLKHAVRTFFYQRAGFAKQAQYAGVDWADGASHIGALQDKNCRLYSDKNNASTERDLHGGWYDAGDYNKYTTWTCNYIEWMMTIYLENPDIWMDNYNIPESGNGIPDLLDEAKWGMDWLLRMQQENGSVLCIMQLGHGSPPSSVREQSSYGPATTMATFSAAKAFAIGCKVYSSIPGMTAYANTLKTAALKAWNWATNNPDVLFYNSGKQAAGEQEVDAAYSRTAIKIAAALYLFEITGGNSFHDFFAQNYRELPIFAWYNDMQQYWSSDHFLLFYYLELENGSQTIKNDIISALKIGINKPADYAGKLGKDGYRSFIKTYNWGSNQYKANYGTTFYYFAEKSLEPEKNELYYAAAEDYLHYIHGVNPLGIAYLSNMNNYGATNSATEFYHSWFSDGTRWDKNPAPGFVPGGPNEYYKWDGCCPSGCGSAQNNALCYSIEIPKNQPAAKMYKNFNNNWPINSWEVTENSCGYQMPYIRLLSKFVSRGDVTHTKQEYEQSGKPLVYPNPATEMINISSLAEEPVTAIELFDMQMRMLEKRQTNNSVVQIDVSALPAGIYFLRIVTPGKIYVEKIIVNSK